MDDVVAAWRADRAYLVNLAYGILADIGAAEDAVQEAFVRFAAASGIENRRAWLTVVTSRICLDVVTSARARREQVRDMAADDFTQRAASGQQAVDPADRVTLDDEVGMALRLVLDRLAPAERVVFVLHDVFGAPFDNIAETVGRPVASCRQLARRARAKIRADGAPTVVDEAQHRLVAERFIRACAEGDIDGLVSLLDPGVWGSAELGPDDPRTGVVNHGAAKVSRNLMRWFGPATTLVHDTLSGDLLAFRERRPYAVVRLDLNAGLVRSVRVSVDPAAAAADLAGQG